MKTAANKCVDCGRLINRSCGKIRCGRCAKVARNAWKRKQQLFLTMGAGI